MPTKGGSCDGRAGPRLPRVRAAARGEPGPRADAPPRRRHPRRQPPLGQGHRRQHSARPPGGRGQDRRAARLVRRARRRGGHAVAALHRQPGPAGLPSCSRCCGSSSPPWAPWSRARRRPIGASTRWARSTCCRSQRPRCSRPPPRPPRPTPGLMVNVAVGYGGRREIADAVRSLLAEHSARGTTARRPGAAIDRRAHRRAPLHPRAARPRPRHPHLGRAAAERLPALAERALGVLLLRGLLAGLPPGGLPARAAGLRRSRPPLRLLNGGLRAPESPTRRRGVAICGTSRRTFGRSAQRLPDRIRKRRESGGLLDEHEAAQRERRRP